MGAPTTILVPIQLDALVVNTEVRQGQPFQRWQANYALVRHRLSPEPPPFAGIDTEIAVQPDREGVYLQWQLPAALTHGEGEHPDADVEFPVVPNRWLVVRTWNEDGTRARAAWLVESDYLDPEAGTSPYLDRDGQVTRIGRRIALDEGRWAEPGPPEGGLFLTAVGPGVATFSAYQPYNTNVFSIHDTLDELDPAQRHTVSYLVAGWYSTVSRDPAGVRDPSELTTLLEHFGWQIAGEETGIESGSTRMICHGTVLGLTWNRGGEMPDSPRPETVDVAVGHTSAHANGALLATADIEGAGGALSPAALLGALHLGVLEDEDEADGEFNAARRTLASWFEPAASGYEWRLEQIPAGPDEQSPAARRAARASAIAFLDRLNTDQAAYDSAAADLTAARRRLYDLWWAQGLPQFPEPLPDQPAPASPGAYQQALDERIADAEQDVRRREAAVADARALIPWGMTADEMDAAIAAYAGNNIPDFVLKRVPLPAAYGPNEPLVLLRGSKSDQMSLATAAEQLVCRRPADLVTGVYLDTERTRRVSYPTGTVPEPANLPADPPELAALLAEFAHLDPAGADELADATDLTAADRAALREAMADPHGRADGSVPQLGTTAWRQPWSPLFFQWEADYYPITFTAPGDAADPALANWAFDGDRYHWTGRGAVLDPLILRGRQCLTPTPAMGMAGAFHRVAQNLPAGLGATLHDLGDLAAQADLTAQTLDGHNDQLLGRSVNPAVAFVGAANSTDATADVRSVMTPGSRAVRDAVAEQTALRRPPEVSSLPGLDDKFPPSRFQVVRSGQLAFVRVSVVDRFGRAAPVVIPDPIGERQPGDGAFETIGNGTPASQFRPILAEDLRPDRDTENKPITVIDQDAERFVELKPRLPQAARTRLDPLTAADDIPVTEEHAGAALGGWLLANHLDRSILCYAADGTGLGAVARAVSTSGAAIAGWLSLPDSPCPDVEDLAAHHPHLHDFVVALIDRGPAALQALLGAVERTLTTIAPTGELPADTTVARLLARPLALVRARVRIDLDGPPLTDPAWKNLLDPAPSTLDTIRWPVRLGELDDLGDGLVGYVREREYHTWHSVLSPEDLATIGDGAGYLTPIEAGHGIALPALDPTAHDERSTARLTLLMDPFGTVNATTGILPTAALRLPAGAFETPLARIAAAFRFGPLLVRPLPAAEGADPAELDGVLALTRPPDQHGVWQWYQPAAEGTWHRFATRPATTAPVLPLPLPRLRTGWLQVHPAAEETP
ncbi:hypothetical protein [Amycolatopsis panacis]|uniref:Uncharacterized protein n=1 Tax=Amycolatopsis panacis TaxID=2340917 RepID=A0A419I264_9PSEU|nr:hypothetical protein [Amycolatopsis panacis]RJQ83879.1 hypothetical protein D5S19_18920 [Amycolatopsis panacis]